MDDDDFFIVVQDGETTFAVLDVPAIPLVVNDPVTELLVLNEGAPGAPGRDGSGGAALIFALNSVSSYAATHAFAYKPTVVLLDSGGAPVEADYVYVNSQVVFTFPQPFTGTLYLG